jgi:hypothetical protein
MLDVGAWCFGRRGTVGRPSVVSFLLIPLDSRARLRDYLCELTASLHLPVQAESIETCSALPVGTYSDLN